MAEGLWEGPVKVLSKNYPEQAIGLIENGEAILTTRGRRFTLVPGLNKKPGTVSFKSADLPDTYLRHCDYFLSAENKHKVKNKKCFLEDASFRVHRGRYFPGFISFESANFPGHFVRHCDSKLRISDESQEPNSEVFQNDSSFRLVDGPYYLQSKNYPEHKFSLKKEKEAWMQDHGDRFYLVRPSLGGASDSVSVAPCCRPDKVLRHCNSELFAENPCDCDDHRKLELMTQDASFVLRESKFAEGYAALESVNYPGSFVRHCCARLRIDEDDGSPVMHDDACFRTVQGPGILRSVNYPDSGMSCNKNDEGVLSTDINRFMLVYPGINKQPGSVSLELFSRPGHYLRHYKSELYLEDRNRARDKDKFRDDATFHLREDAWFPETMSFESFNHPGYFIRHCNYRLRIDKFTDKDLYKQDASFKLC